MAFARTDRHRLVFIGNHYMTLMLRVVVCTDSHDSVQRELVIIPHEGALGRRPLVHGQVVESRPVLVALVRQLSFLHEVLHVTQIHNSCIGIRRR